MCVRNMRNTRILCKYHELKWSLSSIVRYLLGINQVIHLGYVATTRSLNRARNSARMQALRDAEAQILKIANQRGLTVYSRAITYVAFEEKIMSKPLSNSWSRNEANIPEGNFENFIKSDKVKISEQVLLAHVAIRATFYQGRK